MEDSNTMNYIRDLMYLRMQLDEEKKLTEFKNNANINVSIDEAAVTNRNRLELEEICNDLNIDLLSDFSYFHLKCRIIIRIRNNLVMIFTVYYD